MKKFLLLAILPIIACGSATTPEATPTNALDQPRLNSPITSHPVATPTTCPSSQNPIRTPPQALPPSAGACPP